MSLSHNGYVFKSSMAFRTCDSENLRTTTRYDSDMASKRVVSLRPCRYRARLLSRRQVPSSPPRPRPGRLAGSPRLAAMLGGPALPRSLRGSVGAAAGEADLCHAVVVAVALPAEPVPLPPRYALRWTGWRPSVACSFAIAIADLTSYFQVIQCTLAHVSGKLCKHGTDRL